MSPDELRSIPKGQFIVMKTGSHPMKTRLRLFLDWGITFEDTYTVTEWADRRVRYAGCEELERSIIQQRNAVPVEEPQMEQPQREQQETPLPAESKALMVMENQSNHKATFVYRGDEP